MRKIDLAIGDSAIVSNKPKMAWFLFGLSYPLTPADFIYP